MQILRTIKTFATLVIWITCVLEFYMKEVDGNSTCDDKFNELRNSNTKFLSVTYQSTYVKMASTIQFKCKFEQGSQTNVLLSISNQHIYSKNKFNLFKSYLKYFNYDTNTQKLESSNGYWKNEKFYRISATTRYIILEFTVSCEDANVFYICTGVDNDSKKQKSTIVSIHVHQYHIIDIEDIVFYYGYYKQDGTKTELSNKGKNFSISVECVFMMCPTTLYWSEGISGFGCNTSLTKKSKIDDFYSKQVYMRIELYNSSCSISPEKQVVRCGLYTKFGLMQHIIRVSTKSCPFVFQSENILIVLLLASFVILFHSMILLRNGYLRAKELILIHGKDVSEPEPKSSTSIKNFSNVF